MGEIFQWEGGLHSGWLKVNRTKTKGREKGESFEGKEKKRGTSRGRGRGEPLTTPLLGGGPSSSCVLTCA
jgi:hypothetical protein